MRAGHRCGRRACRSTATRACWPIPTSGADGELFAGNLANCPLHIVNGGRDRLYPAASVAPLIEMFKKGGIPLVVAGLSRGRPRHQLVAGGAAALRGVPRRRIRASAHPETVSWETERTDRYNRFRWLVIDRLGTRPGDAALPDVNEFSPTPVARVPLYDRDAPVGPRGRHAAAATRST